MFLQGHFQSIANYAIDQNSALQSTFKRHNMLLRALKWRAGVEFKCEKGKVPLSMRGTAHPLRQSWSGSHAGGYQRGADVSQSGPERSVLADRLSQDHGRRTLGRF